MTNPKIPIARFVMNYGAITGAAFIVSHLMFFWMGLTNTEKDQSGWLNFFFLVAGIVWICKKYRDEENGGLLSYGQGVGIGTLLGLFSGIILAFYLYVFYLLSPVNIDNYIGFIEEQLVTQGSMTDDQIESMVQIYQKVLSPFTMSISSIFASTLQGVLIALVTSFFLRKESDSPFDQAMRNIDE